MASDYNHTKKYVDGTTCLSVFREEFITQWNYLMAATTLIMLPLLVMYVFMQKYFVKGIMIGAVKG